MVGSSSRIKAEKGSVIVLIVIVIPIFLLVTGMVIDIGRAFIVKEELNKACMIAAEEATRCINIDIAEEYGTNTLSTEYNSIINDFFYYNFAEKDYCKINYINHYIAGGSGNPKYIEVICEAEIDCFFLKMVSIETIKIHSVANGRLRRIK